MNDLLANYSDEDAAAIQALAQPGTYVYSDLILPSGREWPADEANAVIAELVADTMRPSDADFDATMQQWLD